MQKESKTMGHHGMPSDIKSNRALKISAWLTGIYFVIELGLGININSIAVISDAFHTFSAVGGVLLAYIAARIAIKPADKYKTFGKFRAEIIGALFNGFFLLGMALFIVYMGAMRLEHPIEIPTTPMFIAAIGGIITEVISIKLLFSGQKENINLKGAYWHVIQTFVGSIIIIVAAIVIRFTGFFAIDPILGILFGLVLLYVSYGIIKDSLNILLESTPSNIDLDEVKSDIEKVSGVKDVHHIHAWVLTSGKNVFSSHVLIEDSKESERILEEIKGILYEKYDFYFSTIQIETGYKGKKAQHIDIT
ncbi:cation diffusion facilitator family transporter [Methanobacterium oryzae]|uniref:cation diffusion facilitator family transporter n=1 Tax=Methanobacterium oryzae TaxID=69540 RepID=UPI003D20BA91